MREETRKQLNRLLWIERAKKVGAALAIVGAIGAYFAFETLDLQVTDQQVHGTVVEIDPLIAKGIGDGQGETLQVKLDGGQTVRVLAYKSRNVKVGDGVDVTEHHHGSGRVTHTLH